MKRSLVLAGLLAACGPSGAARDWSAAEKATLARLEWKGAGRVDPTNRFQTDPAAAKLGQRLFFDVALSATNTVSCASCHDPAKGFGDGLAVAEGAFTGRRNTRTVLGAAESSWLLWDGRKDSAWAQALGPIENPTEHGFTRLEAVRVLRSRYSAEYEAVFGPLPAVDDERWPARAMPVLDDPGGAVNQAWEALSEADRVAVNTAYANLGKAIAAYEAKLVPGRAPFDDYVRAVQAGEPSDALSADAIAGLRLFIGKGDCLACHGGPRFTDDSFHNLGLPTDGEPDRGRSVGARAVLDDPFNCLGPYSDAPGSCGELSFLDPTFREFEGAFRTPSLRHVAETAPYMHDGQLATLADVLAFYSELPGTAAVGHREPLLAPLGFSASELAQLEAFLRSLTGAPVDVSLARSP
jgi:cytochrome c peroxidase